jgi:BirA family biotin operon repressor/biotin-[acetyl-CoA-carboxylase] ligase
MLRQLHMDDCDSTQDVLERHLEESPDDQWLISTTSQRSGRGRGDKNWDHLSGGLAFSFNAPLHPEGTWQSLEVALVVAQWFEKQGHPLELKWPNDLYRDGLKCGGILLKSSHGQMIIGVGINLLASDTWGHAWKNGGLPSDHQQTFPRHIVEFYHSCRSHPSTVIRREWEKRCLHVGRVVTITEGETVTSGRFIGLGKHGEALIDTPRGVQSLFNGTLRWEA